MGMELTDFEQRERGERVGGQQCRVYRDKQWKTKERRRESDFGRAEVH